MVIMARRMARARHCCGEPKDDDETPAEAYPLSTSAWHPKLSSPQTLISVMLMEA
jgi:hypothetical protein